MTDLEHLEEIITEIWNNGQSWFSIRELAIEIINAGYERTSFVENTK